MSNESIYNDVKNYGSLDNHDNYINKNDDNNNHVCCDKYKDLPCMLCCGPCWLIYCFYYAEF